MIERENMSAMSRLTAAIEAERNDMKLMLDDDLSDAVDRACERICDEFNIEDEYMVGQIWGELYV